MIACCLHDPALTAYPRCRPDCIVTAVAVAFEQRPFLPGSFKRNGAHLPACGAASAAPSTYTANWRWDLALYMAFADLRIFTNGKQAGQATYDSLSGGANMSKFIKADEKIGELVDQLFARVK